MDIRFGTFNLYQFAAPPVAWYAPHNTYSDSDWSDKKAWVIAQLNEMACDVVGFQEVFSPDELEALVNAAGYPHFAVVDIPAKGDDDDNVYVGPVVAIASKFPLVSAEKVSFNDNSSQHLPLKEDTEFSRTPIRAEVQIDGAANAIVYVAHFKSKRPVSIPSDVCDNAAWDERVLASMQARSIGNVASMLQRGAEASELYENISKDLHASSETPVVLLGDLNDNIHSIAIEALSNRGRVYDIDGVAWADLPIEAKVASYKLKLYDAFDMAPNPDGTARTPTHYHRGEGGTLDYVFVSNALNEKNNNAAGRVSGFDVYDAHLKNDGVSNKKQSDHAQVVATVAFN